MTTGIPPNFEEHWEGANVILCTQNSNGKKLHANKEILGDNSSYFKAMFFSGFKEAYEDSIELDFEYKYMLNILQIIHSGEDHLVGVSKTDLLEICRIADMLDFPNIRSMYFERIEANVRKPRNHRDVIVNCLEKMTINELKGFVEIKGDTPQFCKKDVAVVLEKFNKTILLEKKEIEATGLEEICNILEPHGFIYETMEWFGADVHIFARNYDGDLKLITANSGVLSTASKQFRQMFSNTRSVELNVDYITMKTIIYILRNAYWCYYDISLWKTIQLLMLRLINVKPVTITAFHPILLYDMYRIASEYDIPFIKKFVSERLVEQASAECLEVALKLNLPYLKEQILAKMRPSDLRDWALSHMNINDHFIYRDKNNRLYLIPPLCFNGQLRDKQFMMCHVVGGALSEVEDSRADYELIYHCDGEKIIISSEATDLTLTLNDLRLIFWKLHSTYRPTTVWQIWNVVPSLFQLIVPYSLRRYLVNC